MQAVSGSDGFTPDSQDIRYSARLQRRTGTLLHSVNQVMSHSIHCLENPAMFISAHEPDRMVFAPRTQRPGVPD